MKILHGVLNTDRIPMSGIMDLNLAYSSGTAVIQHVIMSFLPEAIGKGV